MLCNVHLCDELVPFFVRVAEEEALRDVHLQLVVTDRSAFECNATQQRKLYLILCVSL